MRIFLLLPLFVTLAACSSGSDNPAETLDNNPVDALNNNNVTAAGDITDLPDSAPIPDRPAANDTSGIAVTHYAAVTVADGDGDRVDLTGSFFKLGSAVSPSLMLERFSSNTPACKVQNAADSDINDLSVVYVPDVPGVDASAVSAGESIVLTSANGTYASMFERSIGSFIYYDSDDNLHGTAVPAGLIADISGSDAIPALISASIPDVEPLGSVSYGANRAVTPTTRFAWTPSATAGSLLTISTATGNSFFRDTAAINVKVTCLAPDTGTFSFPADIQARLGSDFSGTVPSISRIAVNASQVDSTVFYLIRESFNK